MSEPHWCLTTDEEKEEHLAGSFAMIRLDDHAVVISIRQVVQYGLEEFPVEILAHEIGHHVYTPADLRDNARLAARIRAGLPTREEYSGLVANLYTDLLINDRLQRDAGLNMDGVYKKLKNQGMDQLWNLYMRTYELLWNLEPGTLANGDLDARMQNDASLGARVIRAYAKDWLGGAGRFAALYLPYLLKQKKMTIYVLSPWLDTGQAGASDDAPDGMVEIEDDELDGAVHPSEDEALTGISGLPDERDGEKNKNKSSQPSGGGRELIGGKKNQYRSPSEYTELMESLGVKLDKKDLIIRYYRERALPYLIKFPSRVIREASDPLPESLDVWEPGQSMAELDWIETALRSPVLIPAVTTVKRQYGTTAGNDPERLPVDLYIGVDCSGSMMNPALNLSYPILAGTIMALSALRAGARVQAVLSGEPGRHSKTKDFIRDENEILNVLTGYLGTGYAFGILRLKETFLDGGKITRPAHILVVTDSDIFYMLKEVKNGWQIAKDALNAAGGGGTFVLNMAPYYAQSPDVARMIEGGWNVYVVNNWEDMVEFARAFSKLNYER